MTMRLAEFLVELDRVQRRRIAVLGHLTSPVTGALRRAEGHDEAADLCEREAVLWQRLADSEVDLPGIDATVAPLLTVAAGSRAELLRAQAAECRDSAVALYADLREALAETARLFGDGLVFVAGVGLVRRPADQRGAR